MREGNTERKKAEREKAHSSCMVSLNCKVLSPVPHPGYVDVARTRRARLKGHAGRNASRRNCEFCISLRRYKVPCHLIERGSHHEEYHRKATTDAKKVVKARIRLACGAQLAIRVVTTNCSEKCSGNRQRKHATLGSVSFDNVDRKSVTDPTVRRVRFNWSDGDAVSVPIL